MLPFPLCSWHAPCCCLAAREAAKEIKSFIQKDTLSPQSLTKGVGSCKTKARGTGPLTPHKPLGRLLVSSFHCYAYKNMYQVIVGIKALFGSLLWKNTCTAFYRALAVFSKFSFSGTLLPWWTVLLCWVNKNGELEKALQDHRRTPLVQRQDKHPRMLQLSSSLWIILHI